MINQRSILAAASVLLALSGSQASAARDTSFPTADKRSVQVEMTVMPVFPVTLIAAGITEGNARIAISVNAEGVLTDWLVLAYTNELFAREAVAVIERWHFDPMLVRGNAIPCQTELTVNFEAKGVVISMTPADAVRALMGGRHNRLVYSPCRFSELDRIPAPVLANRPIYPKEFAERGMRGSVTIEFYIDEVGTVRMPAVIAADHEELGYFAVEAVRNWRFEPPTRNGRPVLTLVRQRFEFTGKVT